MSASALKKDKIAQFIVELEKKVQAKIVTQAEAERLAILALEEVMPGENWAEADDEETDEDMAGDQDAEDEGAADPAPAGSAVDPKSELLGALTAFNGATAGAWRTFKQKVESVIRGTSGNAVPIGKYTLGAGETNSNLDIQQKDQASLELSFYFKQDWNVGGLVLPPPTVQPTEGSVKESACHLPLRKRLLALAETLAEASSAELTWRSAKLPMRELADMERIARQEKDLRVLSAVSAAPNSEKAADWSSWAIKAQVYLLGGDYVKTEASVKFEDIK